VTVRILKGDCRHVLKELADESVNCVVTSPPYFGLRDYGVDGQIGLEQTPDAFVAEMVAVFSEVRRVLRPDGTCWLNLGDSYAGAGYSNHANTGGAQREDGGKQKHMTSSGLKNKDLIGIPWRVAFALQADGWYLRQDIIWSKPNPMPESVQDRCTKAHEYIFLLSKSDRYHYDAAAIAEPLAYGSIDRLSQDIEGQENSDRVPSKTNGKMKAVYKKPYTNVSTKDYASSGAQDASATKARIVDKILSGELVTRNKRSVWEITTQPFKGAHFATFPPALIEPCILAGCPKGGTVLDPFGGAGTTGLVADRLGRNAILIELNPEYAAMAERRIKGDAGMFAEVVA
jgi:DNA modification methylase